VRISHFSVQIWILLKKTSLDTGQTITFICSDMDSPQKTSPDTSQTIPFRRGHPTLISVTIIDLAILGATGRILCFPIQIWIPL
jgi:hypothetical protein